MGVLGTEAQAFFAGAVDCAEGCADEEGAGCADEEAVEEGEAETVLRFEEGAFRGGEFEVFGYGDDAAAGEVGGSVVGKGGVHYGRA